jgi:hypothetical protein
MNIRPITICCCFFLLLASLNVSAQNKDIEKAKEKLKEAYQQKDPSKKNDLVQKANELFQKSGLKPGDLKLVMGNAYLDNGDLKTAENQYNSVTDKAAKKEAFAKVGDAWVELAMGDEKKETQYLKNAMGDYKKGDKIKEGASGIGDKFYEKGEKFYVKAIDYYFQATDTPSVTKVARDYEKQGTASGPNLAFDLYKRAGLFKKAGDLAWESKQYAKAYDAYSTGEITEGMRKCADMFYSLGQESEAQNIFLKMVENYAKTANTEAIEKLAHENVAVMNYGFAARIYDKAGNLNSAKKYYALHKFMNLDLDSAKLLLEGTDNANLIKAIDANQKNLLPLKDVKAQFDDWVKQQPPVSIELDPETSQYKVSQKDEQMLVDYYKLIKDQISDQCQIISKNVIAISNPELKKMLMKKFLDYPAVGKILDKTTFAVKLTRSSTQVKDVYLKKI